MIIDSLHLMGTLFSELWWMVLLFAGIAIFRSHFFKVILDEWMISTAVRMHLDREIYHLLRNVVLPGVNGEFRTGHIIVSRYGVFVLEVLNIQGWIFAGQDEQVWTWKCHGATHKFENPLHQGKKRMKMIEETLELDSYMLFPIVTFVGDNTFMTQMPENVAKGVDYVRYIKAKRKIVLTEDDVTDILQHIQSGKLQPLIGSDEAGQQVQGSGKMA